MEMNKLPKKILLVGLCFLALSGQAKSDSLSDAESVYGTGDYVNAAKLYRLAAEQGNAYAQAVLGSLYENGKGVPQEYEEAIRWYRLAAEQGNFGAQLLLGIMYLDGHGVQKNIVLSHMWINISAVNTTDDKTLKNTTTLRNSVAKLMNAQQIAEAQELARKCYASKYKGC